MKCPHCGEQVDELVDDDECAEGMCGEDGYCWDCHAVTEGTEHFECGDCGGRHWCPGEDGP